MYSLMKVKLLVAKYVFNVLDGFKGFKGPRQTLISSTYILVGEWTGSFC